MSEPAGQGAAGAGPAISVIIPTYNWSAALRHAIRSILLQTRQDFEVLVVGDGCTDDSEAVVASFGDARLQWYNLPSNHGSQWAANNFALERARADWVAYLGHDDIWYPTHLESILRTAAAEAADVVTSAVILYGPPASGIRFVSGIFPSGAFGVRDFVPPSAVAHARALYPETIVWRDPAGLVLPMDAVFLTEFAVARRTFAATCEVTAFKFNAAWRRDAYRRRDVAEQARALARIEAGEDFRQAELLGVLQSIASGVGGIVGGTWPGGVAEGEIVRRNRRFKGLEARFEADRLVSIDAPIRFDLAGQDMPFEWYDLEKTASGTTFRWSGPSRRPTIDLPVRFDRDLVVRIGIHHIFGPDRLEDVRLFIQDAELPCRIETGEEGVMLVGELRRASLPQAPDGLGITIDTGRVRRPLDTGLNGDPRWLGVAVSWVELSPVDKADAAPLERDEQPIS